MYVPTVARFTARDPLPENGETVLLMNKPPYAYALGNPVAITDPSGLDPANDAAVAKALKKCEDWSKKAQKDQAWLKRIPNCPCYLCELAHDPNNWTIIEDANQKFHPGAEKCIRSKPKLGIPHGQQCCYKGQELITDGLGAGTPDYYNPLDVVKAPFHKASDVDPFFWCQEAGRLDLYLLGRPPNNGNDCEPQKV